MGQEIDCEVVTVERIVYRGGADMIIAPGTDGQLGILPRHAPLLTSLQEGELIIRRQGEEDLSIAIGGGFMEVLHNRVVVLADSAERADEIDEGRAQRARDRALKDLAERKVGVSEAQAVEAALRRSSVRLKVAQRRQRRRTGGPPQPGGSNFER
jgi:F-type H+-transporting ATPase subunit epsilon